MGSGIRSRWIQFMALNSISAWSQADELVARLLVLQPASVKVGEDCASASVCMHTPTPHTFGPRRISSGVVH